MTDSETDPGRHHTFIFDRVVTNIGDIYNHHTGILTSTELVFTFSHGPFSVIREASLPLNLL